MLTITKLIVTALWQVYLQKYTCKILFGTRQPIATIDDHMKPTMSVTFMATTGN